MKTLLANIPKIIGWIGATANISATVLAKVGTKLSYIDDNGNTKTYDYARPSVANTLQQMEEQRCYLAVTATATNIDDALVTGFGGGSSPSPTPTPNPPSPSPSAGTLVYQANFNGAADTLLTAYTPDLKPSSGWALTGAQVKLDGNGKLITATGGIDDSIVLDIPLPNFRAVIKANMGAYRLFAFKQADPNRINTRIDTSEVGAAYNINFGGWEPIAGVTPIPAVVTNATTGTHTWEFTFNAAQMKAVFDTVTMYDQTVNPINGIPAGTMKFEWNGNIAIESIEVYSL